MKRICLIFWMLLMLAGCKTIADIKPDTIVDIPLHPTELVTEAVTEYTETIPPFEALSSPETEAPTEAATEKPGKPTSGSKPGGKSPGKGSTGSEPAATEPPTQPATQPPTEPLAVPPTEEPTEVPTAPPAYDPSGYSACGLDYAVADAVNARRQEAGLGDLTFDDRLCAIASLRAYELSLEWSHRRPDGSDGLTVLSQYGYGCGWAAENLHNGAGSGERIVERWMSADSTAGNILSEAASAIGVGSYTTPEGLTFVAAIFTG